MEDSNELIKKIHVSDPLVTDALKWLSEGKNKGLNEGSMNEIIRFLLKRVLELENKLTLSEQCTCIRGKSIKHSNGCKIHPDK